MRGKEFIESYEELQNQNQNFVKCINILMREDMREGSDGRFAKESISLIEEKQAIVLLKMNKLENMEMEEV